MPHVLKLSVNTYSMGADRCMLFNNEPRLLYSGSLFACEDWLARFMIKLEARQIIHCYDDLHQELRVDLPKRMPAGTRHVAYQIKQKLALAADIESQKAHRLF